MATWVITLDFQDGGGARDITAYVKTETFRRERIWANELSPASSQLRFAIHRNGTIANLFLSTATKDILVNVTKDGAGYFRGIVQNQFEVGIGVRLHPVSVQCVDRGELLRRKISTTFAWADYEVCTPSATSTSIVHQLLTLAGFTSGDWSLSTTINKTIDYFVNVAQDGRTYWDVLAKLLFEFGYVFYFDASGDFCIGELWPATATSTQTFSGSNLVGDISISKQARRYEGVRLEWAAHKTLTDAIVFSDTTNGDATYKCNIPVAASDWYPEDCESVAIYCEYSIDGHDLIYVSGAAVDTVLGAGLAVDTFTDYYRRARLKIENSGGATAYIKRLDIVGDAVVRGDPRFTLVEFVTGTELLHEFQAEFLTATADATALASGLCRHYRYGYILYQFRSRTLVEPGAICTLQDPILGMNNLVRIAARTDNEVLGEASYLAYGLIAYTAETPTVTGSVSSPTPVAPVTSPHEVTVAVNGYQGAADWYCDGAADDVQIQAADAYLTAAYGGGTIHLTEGTYSIEAAIALSSRVYLKGRGRAATVLEKNCNATGIEIIGTSGSHKSNVRISGFTLKSVDSYAQDLCVVSYCESTWADGIRFENGQAEAINLGNSTDCSVMDCEIVDCKSNGVYMNDCERIMVLNNTVRTSDPENTAIDFSTAIYVGFSPNSRITGNIIGPITSLAALKVINVYGADKVVVDGNTIADCRSTLAGTNSGAKGIFVHGSSDTVISNNSIHGVMCLGETGYPSGDYTDTAIAIDDSTCTGTVVQGNDCRDNGTFLKNGDCETTFAPLVLGETTPALSNATWARSTTQKKIGSYSYKFTKTNAAGTYAYAAFTDSVSAGDLHGLVAGAKYRMKFWVYIPSGGIQASEIVFDAHDGTDETVSPTATYDAWQQLELEFTIAAAATLAYIYVYAASTAAVNEHFYVDFGELVPIGVHNEHNQQFTNTGTATREVGNSWQNPFPS